MGIVHVIGPEQGLTQPGLTLGAATRTPPRTARSGHSPSASARPRSSTCWPRSALAAKAQEMRVSVTGAGPGVAAKDVILAIIAKIGTGGGVGHVIEYAGPIAGMTMEERMTVCNMSIEAGARAGMVAPDETTYRYLRAGRTRRRASMGAGARLLEDSAVRCRRGFDREVSLDGAAIAPMVTWGTSPGGAAHHRRVPDPAGEADHARRQAMGRALDYMGLAPGHAADRHRGGPGLHRLVHQQPHRGPARRGRRREGRRAVVTAWVVPGSGLVKRRPRPRASHEIFTAAGFEWREPGCSMCVGINGDTAREGERVASTSNRNFEGRQGQGARTHLMSPAMAAAAAVTGRLTDVRDLLAPPPREGRG